MRSLTLAAVLISSALPLRNAIAQPQSSTASGACSVAINASHRATVTIHNDCRVYLSADPATRATVDRLARDAQLIRSRLRENQTIGTNNSARVDQLGLEAASLGRDLVMQRRLIEDLASAVLRLQRISQAGNATAGEKVAAAGLVAGEPGAAIGLLRMQADQPDQDTQTRFDLLLEQSALMQAKGDISAAFTAVKGAVTVQESRAALKPRDSGILAALVEARLKEGDLAQLLGDAQMADASYRNALIAVQSLSRANPDERTQRLHFRVLMSLAELNEDEESTSAIEYYRSALEVHGRLLDAEPDDRTLSEERAEILEAIARQERLNGHPENVQDALASAIDIRTRQADDRTDAANLLKLIGLHRRIADLNFAWRRNVGFSRERADSHLGIARQLATAMIERDPTDIRPVKMLARIKGDEARMYGETGQYREAITQYEDEIAILKGLLRKSPNDPEVFRMQSNSFREIGEAKGYIDDTAGQLAANRAWSEAAKKIVAIAEGDTYWETQLLRSQIAILTRAGNLPPEERDQRLKSARSIAARLQQSGELQRDDRRMLQTLESHGR